MQCQPSLPSEPISALPDFNHNPLQLPLRTHRCFPDSSNLPAQPPTHSGNIYFLEFSECKAFQIFWIGRASGQLSDLEEVVVQLLKPAYIESLLFFLDYMNMQIVCVSPLKTSLVPQLQQWLDFSFNQEVLLQWKFQRVGIDSTSLYRLSDVNYAVGYRLDMTSDFVQKQVCLLFSLKIFYLLTTAMISHPG